MLNYQSPPVVEIQNVTTEQAGVRLLVKCEYANHPTVSGNKWWKLKYNIEAAKKSNSKVVTFGGAFSNHIYATAAACHAAGLESVGVIRGEKVEPLNAALKFAREKGMRLDFISRDKYRLKTEQSFINELHDVHGDFYLIPEGGTNELAVKGCAEWAQSELQKITFDHLLLPVGTGGTMSGVICGLEDKVTVTGVSVLKRGEFLRDNISTLIKSFSGRTYGNWNLLTSYHHGGYAKVSEELNRFIVSMKVEHNLPLDHVYTGKVMWAVMEEIKKGEYPRGSTILLLHTGGLQGSL